MGLQLTTSVSVARTILNDPDAARYSAADLLQYANDALDQVAGLIPQLFLTDDTHTCTAGADQTLTHNTAISMFSVNRIQGGDVVTPADLVTLDRFNPSWRTATAGATKNWAMKHGNPLRFLVHPPASAGQILEVTYVKVPSEYLLTEDTGLPGNLIDAITDYVVYRAETRDDEHVNSNRAAQFMATFVTKVKG